ncbi:MAG TPA: ABC transporter permease [Chitinophagaceae bacterium]|nr:ABC transporter permease [Chitinophagaceae bacterium]
MNSYAFHISLYDVLFFTMIIVGMTFALLLGFVKTVNRSANRFLALALVAMILWMARVLAIDIRLNTYLPHWDWLPMQFLLALGPLLYFYVLKITRPQYKFCGKDLLHFAPVVLEQVMQAFQQLNSLLQLFIFISVITYLRQSYKLILQFYTRQPIVMMDRSRLEFRWLRRLLAATAVLWTTWLLFAAIDYFAYNNYPGIQLYYPFYIFFVVMMIWTAAAAFLKPQAAVIAQTSATVKPPVPDELRAKGAWLKRAMEANLYYQDPDLSLSSLAKKLGMHPRELSKIVNTVLKKNFNDFVNEYRVQDMKSKMQDPAYDNKTLLGIAFEAGFNSKATFNRSFRQVTGKSAIEFKNDLEKRDSLHDLKRCHQPAAVISNNQASFKWADVKLNRHFMFRNYIKIAWRNLARQKGLSFINIFCLSVGIACFILLLLYSSYQLSFDKFHANAADIYRPYIWNELTGDGHSIAYTDYSGPSATTLGEAMKQSLPDVVDYTRIQLPSGENLFRVNNKIHRVSISFADPSLFSMFSFPLKYGTPQTALHDIDDIVLSEAKAKQIFGNENPVGKTVDIQIGASFRPFKISAVAVNAPANSTIQFDVLGTFIFALKNQNSFFIGNNWHPTVVQTFVRLKHGSTLATDAKRLNRFIETFNPRFAADTKDYVAMMQKQGVAWNGNGLPQTFRMQPLLAIHTDASFTAWGFTDYGKTDPKIIWMLLAIAAGILLIACINFTTLSIGRSAARSKEVGVRKVAGAGKIQIVTQFLAEALLLAFISTLLGLLLVILLLPWFNQLAGTSLSFSFMLQPAIILLLVGAVLLAGLLAGSYPALVIANFKPVEVLKSKIRVGGSNFFTRSLVTFQFVISIVLIVATIIILQQTKYMLNKNPGFEKENVVVIDASQVDPNVVFPLFKQAAIKSPLVSGVTSAAAGLGAGQDFLGYSDPAYGLWADINIIDTGYIRVMGMQLMAGQNLRQQQLFGGAYRQMIINETMMRAFGWTLQNAVGKQIKNFQGSTAIVAGVVKDFNYRPLNNAIKNQVFETSTDNGYSIFYARIAAGNPAAALAALQGAWRTAAHGIPIKYSFLDEEVNRYYTAEQKWSSLMAVAGGISILLASLGLLGLAALAAVNRTKEIGIRKVLGASVPNIIMLMSKGFLRQVMVAFIIATPVAWYCMRQWLQGYAYRVHINITVFLLSGAFAVITALATISYQAIKAALSNPVRNLRSE